MTMDDDIKRAIEIEMDRLREWSIQMEAGKARFLQGNVDCTFQAIDSFNEAIVNLQRLIDAPH